MEDTSWERLAEERDMSGLGNQIDWSTAPEDAQFYSQGSFRKLQGNVELRWARQTWRPTMYENLDKHKEYEDFQLRPAISKERMDEILSEAMNKAISDTSDHLSKAWCGASYDLGQPVGALKEQSGAIKSDGGSSSYYDIQLPDWLIDLIVERRYIKTEELIEVLGDSFNQGTILKCLVRLNSLLSGIGKEGNSVDYECNKIIYYANRIKEENNR